MRLGYRVRCARLLDGPAPCVLAKMLHTETLFLPLQSRQQGLRTPKVFIQEWKPRGDFHQLDARLRLLVYYVSADTTPLMEQDFIMVTQTRRWSRGCVIFFFFLLTQKRLIEWNTLWWSDFKSSGWVWVLGAVQTPHRGFCLISFFMLISKKLTYIYIKKKKNLTKINIKPSTGFKSATHPAYKHLKKYIYIYKENTWNQTYENNKKSKKCSNKCARRNK